jgi:hypothetical protein
MKTFHFVAEHVIVAIVALGALVFTLAALAHALSHAKIVW